MSLPPRHLGDRVAALVDGRLAPGERAAVLDHLARCPACRAQYDEQRVIKGLLGELRGVDAPDDLTLRLARLAGPSLPGPGQSAFAPVAGRTEASVRVDRHARSAGQRVRLAGAGLLSVGVVGVGAAYAAGAAPGGLAVVPPVDRFVREHDHVSGSLPLAEPVLAQVPASAGSTTLPTMSATAATASLPASALTTPAGPLSDPAAVGLLQRGLAADTALPFAGTEVVRTAGAADQQVQVAHLPGRGAVLTTTDGGGTHAVFDTDSQVWNDRMLSLLSGSYRLVVGSDSTLLGRPTHTVQALRSDGTTAAQFQLDATSGMLLARTQYDRGGAVVRSTTFSVLRFAVTTPTHLPPMLPSARTAGLSTSESARWAAGGWPCPLQLGGLTLVGAAAVSGTGNPVLHLTYSDGLSVVSLFVQSGHLDDALGASGRTATVGGQLVRTVPVAEGSDPVFWAAAGWVFTVVSDAPDGAVDAVVAALPHQGPDQNAANLPDRLGRGAGRVLAWLNPLD